MTSSPWMKFYPRDWRGDQALRAVTVAARGLWIECLCIMHEAKPYGHLLLAGQPVDSDLLARMAGIPSDQVAELIGELEKAGVLSRTAKGVVYSRRMIKDAQRSKEGQKSAQKRWTKNAENKGERPPPNGSPNREPMRSPITQKPEARGQRKEKGPSDKGPSLSIVPKNGKVWIAFDSTQWDAWDRYRRANGMGSFPQRFDRERKENGWMADSEWPPVDMAANA